MTTLDFHHQRAAASPIRQETHEWLAFIGDLTRGTITLVAFLAVAFVAL